MKVECVKDKLERAIGKATRVTSKNVTLPVLQCVLLEAADSQLSIRATNLDLGVELSVPVKVSTPGVVAVPGSVLASFLANVSDGSVTLELEGEQLVVRTAGTSTKINTYNHEDFPTIPRIEDGTSFQVPSATFAKGLNAVSYSAATSSMKPELSSVYIAPADDQRSLVFTATDSFRLAEKRVAVTGLPAFEYVLIPVKNTNEITRMLEEYDGDIKVLIGDGQIAFVGDGLYVTSRTVDGVFPDYKQIIPSEFAAEATVLKNDLVTALKVATIFTDKFNLVAVAIDPGKKEFTIQTKNSDVGENTYTLDGALSGEAVAINFNHKYIRDSFQSIAADSVVLKLSGTGKPMVMSGVSDTSFLYLVMPMNR
ncbi:MAG: DNA polymerase III subunit beta [Candidatus Paceibacterota bacterium]